MTPNQDQMQKATPSAADSADRVLVITRIFDAPRHLVWKAWTDPAHLAQWWGPHGFTLPSCQMDLRAGGAYRFHMRGPNEDDHYSQGLFREVVEPSKLVMIGSWADAAGNPTRPGTVLTVTFEDLGGKTKLTLHQAVFESVTARDEHRGGWSGSFDKLAEYLATV
ncbi:MAG TPA: SRPBCC domain-containing protein [Candidatus Acidoferrales bacterium]|nr:SRPBCC domain-containing protein [Candidatus Acidoferrales bacterium]